MGIFDFFSSGQKPEPAMEHPVLGALRWNAAEKEWEGSFNGFSFTLDYERVATPTPELLAYALEMLSHPELMLAPLAAEKQQFVAKHPYNADEIDPLHISSIGFYRYKGSCRIFASLDPESEEGHCWRMEFEGKTFKGLGFDS